MTDDDVVVSEAQQRSTTFSEMLATTWEQET